jgi:hypothetical protein
MVAKINESVKLARLARILEIINQSELVFAVHVPDPFESVFN